MKMPNGYGAIVHLKGKRRRPYAVRTSSRGEYINIIAPQELPKDVLHSLKKLGFRYKKTESVWTALLSDKTKAFAIKFSEGHGYVLSVSFRQYYSYHGYFEKSSEAHTFLAEWNNGHIVKEETKFVDSITFSEMYMKWKEYRQGLKRKLSASTWMAYDAAYKNLHQLHQRVFSYIKSIDIQNIINEYNGKSKSTVTNMGLVLHAMYNYAIMNKYVSDDATKFLVYEWDEPKKNIHKAFSKEELSILWDNLYKVENIDLLLIYIYTGVRPTELLAILTKNVHLEERYFIGGIKTESGINRTIPIADKIFPLVKKFYDPSREYLVTHDGLPIQYNEYYYRIFTPIMNKFSFNHLPHDTRHTFASMMDSAGANIVCTKLIMGHSMHGDITKSIYTHKTVKELLFEVNKI